MGDNSDDEVLEISRDQFVQKVDEEEDGINMKEGFGKTSKGKEHDVDCTSKGIIAGGSLSLKNDVSTEIYTNNMLLLVIIWYPLEGNKFLIINVKENLSSVGSSKSKNVGSSKSKKTLHGTKSGKDTINEDPELLNFTRKGEYRLRLPVGVSNRAGFTKKLHTLKIENLQGHVSIYEVKAEKNGSGVRYSVINWPVFMAENNLNDGDMLDFTYVTSKKTLILKNVRYV
ncbi:putative transcription factor B3-Domain family [Helianthus annuus]|nr:putative transcription factor B3-Domain family [Helianthus annuus]